MTSIVVVLTGVVVVFPNTFKDTLDGLARASGLRWYGHVLRKDNDDVLRRALDFEVAKRKKAWATEYVKKTCERTHRSDWTKKGRRH